MALEKGVGSLYMAVLLDSMGAFMVMPLLPYLAKEFGASAVEVSLLQTAFAGCQTVGTILLGSLSDYCGRRKILLVTLSGCCVALLFCGLSQTVWQLILARAFNGAFASTVSVCQTMIAERTPDEKKAEALAKVMGVFSIGVLAGPVFGGFLQEPLGSSGVCFAGCALTAFNVAWAFFQLEEVPPSSETDAATPKESELADPVMEALGMLWKRPVILQILACTFLQTSVLGFWMGSGAWYNLQEYGFAAWQNGLLIAIGGGAMLFCQFNVTGPAVKQFGELGCIWLGSALRSTAMLVYALAPPSTNPLDLVPYVCMTILMTTMAIVDPSLQTLTMQVAPAQSIGTIMGIAQALRSGGEAVGPVVAAYAYEIDHSLPWLLAAACAVLGGFLYVAEKPRQCSQGDALPSMLTSNSEKDAKRNLEEPLLSA